MPISCFSCFPWLHEQCWAGPARLLHVAWEERLLSTSVVLAARPSVPSMPERSDAGKPPLPADTEVEDRVRALHEEEAKPDAFRAKLLCRLRHNNVWVAPDRRPPRHQQVTIFDWDDTLLCTSALHNPHTIPAAVLRELEEACISIVRKAMEYGQTFIITNAVEGWVERSAERYYPSLAELVLPHVKIISARSEHEEDFPNDTAAWKIQAFLEVRRALPKQGIITNLLSIGDAEPEMRAIAAMAHDFPDALVKTVKLLSEPTAEQLLKQVSMVCQEFDRVSNGANDVTLFLQQTSPRENLRENAAGSSASVERLVTPQRSNPLRRVLQTVLADLAWATA